MTTDSKAPFDPANEVPDEYDVFCEACGYSLAGLTGERCPECGAAVDPAGLPFARVPWLHRRRIGKARAYLRTVWLVSVHPAAFARELCRPVRISAADARRFRLATIHLLTRLAAVPALVALAYAIFRFYQTPPRFRSFNGPQRVDFVFTSLAVLAAIACFHMFLRLATDMPLFIWKGHPSLKASELSPVHQYAAAPLALLPVAAGVVAWMVYLREHSMLDARREFTWLAVAAGCVVPVWLWVVALVLMRISSRPSTRRLLLMAVYLPTHWLLMFALSGMIWLAFLQAERIANDLLRLGSQMWR